MAKHVFDDAEITETSSRQTDDYIACFYHINRAFPETFRSRNPKYLNAKINIHILNKEIGVISNVFLKLHIIGV